MVLLVAWVPEKLWCFLLLEELTGLRSTVKSIGDYLFTFETESLEA